MPNSPNKWTNQSLRQHLGERGFLPQDTIRMHDDEYYTEFVRETDSLTLVEFNDQAEPQVYQNGKQVDPTNIGYRNRQIQNIKKED